MKSNFGPDVFKVITKEEFESFKINERAFIFRGMNINPAPDYYYFDPKNFFRASVNTNNLYTTWMEIDSDWHKFPPRKKSLICSNSLSRSGSFGKLYEVYPLEKTPIGVCSEDDIWYSFKLNEYVKYYKYKGVSKMQINFINTMFGELFILLKKFEKGDFYFHKELADILNSGEWKNYFYYKEEFYELDKLLKSVDLDNFDHYMKRQEITMSFTFEFVKDLKKTGLFKFLDYMLDPYRNEFMLVNDPKDIPTDKEREVWLSGKCLLKRNR